MVFRVDVVVVAICSCLVGTARSAKSDVCVVLAAVEFIILLIMRPLNGLVVIECGVSCFLQFLSCKLVVVVVHVVGWWLTLVVVVVVIFGCLHSEGWFDSFAVCLLVLGVRSV